MSNHANPEVVAQYWIKGVSGIPSDKVATTLPSDHSSFASTGFVTVMSYGGTPDKDTFMQNSSVQVDVWGYAENSSKLPWGQTLNLAMLIKAGVENAARLVEIPKYNSARVREVIVLTDPRRVSGDENFARYSMDLQVVWTEVR